MRPQVAFLVVGAAGFLVQITVLAALNIGLGLSPLVSTALAVEAAVLTNYFCHERWTWAHRAPDARHRLDRLWRFHVTAVTSIVGNLVATAFCVAYAGLSVLAANTVAVVVLGIVNYVTADRWVFAARAASAALLLTAVSAATASAAEPGSATLSAWSTHVARVEASLTQHEQDPPVPEPRGVSIDVPGGTIYECRGSVRVENATVSDVVDRLIATAGDPFEDDVLAAKILSRGTDRLRLYLKLQRKVLVTATYDTEHEVQYSRRSAVFATSRSVSTRIAEVGTADRGFLWKLNSYWRYRQVGTAVQVDVLSVSLSRDVPWMIRPVAQPIIGRIGRESMLRTLAATRRRVAREG
jgi:putative flippase GtrA